MSLCTSRRVHQQHHSEFDSSLLFQQPILASIVASQIQIHRSKMAVLRFIIASLILSVCFIQNGSTRTIEPVNLDNSNEIEIGFGSINEFLKLHPDAKIEQLEIQREVQGRINYTLGSRINGKPMDLFYLINLFLLVRFLSQT